MTERRSDLIEEENGERNKSDKDGCDFILQTVLMTVSLQEEGFCIKHVYMLITL